MHIKSTDIPKQERVSKFIDDVILLIQGHQLSYEDVEFSLSEIKELSKSKMTIALDRSKDDCQ